MPLPEEPLNRLETGCVISLLDLCAGILAIGFIGLGSAGYPVAYVGIFLVLVWLVFGRKMFGGTARKSPKDSSENQDQDSG